MLFGKRDTDAAGMEALKKENADLKKELAYYKELAGFSHQEGLVVIDGTGNLVFKNENAQRFKNDAEVVRALQGGEDEVVLEQCDVNVRSRRLANGATAYAVVKASLTGGEGNHLLGMHQASIKEALNRTQSVFVELLEKLDDVVEQSKETAEGSADGKRVVGDVTADMDQLLSYMSSASQMSRSLVERSGEITNVITLIEDIRPTFWR